MKRVILVVLIATTALAATDGGTPAPRGLVDWLCSVLGFSCSGGLDAVRSESRQWGTEVRRFDQRTGRERLLFKCRSCRSPLPLSGRGAVAVATPSGVLVVGEDAGRREVPLPGVVQLVGVTPDAGARLLALTEVARDGGARFEVVVVDLDDGGVELLGDVPAQEVAVRPGQASSAGVVFSKESADLAIAPRVDRRGAKLLLRPQDTLLPPAVRFDPIWGLDGGVIFTARVPE
ncbi:MAG: hypothetical protein U0228_31135 [Myxococcaceae bacterium]